MNVPHLSYLAATERLKSFFELGTEDGCLIKMFGELGCKRAPASKYLKRCTRFNKKLHISEAFDNVLKGNCHCIRAELMPWNGDKNSFCFSKFDAGYCFKGKDGLVGSVVNRFLKRVRARANMKYRTLHECVNRGSSSNQRPFIGLSQQLGGMPVLSTHYENCYAQCRDGTDSLHPARPIGLGEFVVISQYDDIDDAEKHEQGNRKVWIFHALAKSCLKGIIA